MSCAVDLLGVLGFFVALASIIVSFYQYRLHRKQIRAELLSKYSARYCIDKDINKVVRFLEQEEGLKLRNPAEKPDEHEVELFMHYFEEIELLIRAKSIDEKVVSYMFFYYLQTFEKLKENWKGIDYESNDWKVFHEFLIRMKKVREDRNTYKI